MAQLYQLVPLAQGPLSGLDLVSRAVVGAIYDRIRLSSYNVAGGHGRWYDAAEGRVYCVYSQSELAALIGVSDRTIRRSLELLKQDNLVWYRKAAYRGACRYYLHDGILDYLSPHRDTLVASSDHP